MTDELVNGRVLGMMGHGGGSAPAKEGKCTKADRREISQRKGAAYGRDRARARFESCAPPALVAYFEPVFPLLK